MSEAKNGAGVATNRFGDSYPIDAKGDPLPFSDEELASLREHEPPVGGMDDRFLRTIAALEQRLSEGSTFALTQRTADTLDAERYRYLRDSAALEEDGPSVVSGLGDLFEYHWGAEVDEEVDAAMARWKAAGSPK